MKTYVSRFGEKGTDKWYESQGNRINCNEEIIDKLWWQWIINPTAKREDDEHYVIFGVTEPLLIIP